MENRVSETLSIKHRIESSCSSSRVASPRVNHPLTGAYWFIETACGKVKREGSSGGLECREDLLALECVCVWVCVLPV